MHMYDWNSSTSEFLKAQETSASRRLVLPSGSRRLKSPLFIHPDVHAETADVSQNAEDVQMQQIMKTLT